MCTIQCCAKLGYGGENSIIFFYGPEIQKLMNRAFISTADPAQADTSFRGTLLVPREDVLQRKLAPGVLREDPR